MTVNMLRAVNHEIATGVWPDMTEHGWTADAWPGIYQQGRAADILVRLRQPRLSLSLFFNLHGWDLGVSRILCRVVPACRYA